MSTRVKGRLQDLIDARRAEALAAIDAAEDLEDLRLIAKQYAGSWSILYSHMIDQHRELADRSEATRVQLQRYGLDPLQPEHERLSVEEAQANILIDRAMLDALTPAERLKLLGPMLFDDNALEDEIFDLENDDEED